ncbi:hypothetical protein KPL76_06585 [Subtercola sp. PAMC28395]|uniref:sensor histidine kinase n=1 Tax=Subtercola sp. PAMC28395 TaxID=2846775 RepID=UPI001C0E35BA|nr:ATP-binding protein [Subtercola sp. PAMC28395]QWT25010.1 hypothetical protein KPL76_06585 [Subtercola sp. PAMC28395]
MNRLRGAISRSSVDLIMVRAAALFALLFAAQSIVAAVQSASFLYPVWAVSVPSVLFALLLLVVVASVINRGVTLLMTAFALVYLVALALVPLSVENLGAAHFSQPWLWYLVTLGMAFTALVWPTRWAITFAAFVTAEYMVIRTLPAGGGAAPQLAILDGLYVLLIGAFMIMLITTLRVAADRVDAAQLTATQQVARAARHHAVEFERAKVDALVHDTVLATLIAAAKAVTPAERERAARMAQSSLQTLQHAPIAFDPDSEVSLRAFSDRLAAAIILLSPRITFTVGQLDDRGVPGRVADALFSAAIQALINSLQHAGPGTAEPDRVARSVTLQVAPRNEITIRVSDSGIGFDTAAVPSERLGLRVSIRERVEAVGGSVSIESAPGRGASVIIEWKDYQRS